MKIMEQLLAQWGHSYPMIEACSLWIAFIQWAQARVRQQRLCMIADPGLYLEPRCSHQITMHLAFLCVW